LGSTENMNNIVAGHKAPEFSLPSIDGKDYTLAELLKRGPVLAAFFKISCPVCQFTFPFLERLYQRYGSAEVTFLGISQDDKRATKEFADEYGTTFPMVMDTAGYPASNAYGLTSVPSIFLIDTEGAVGLTCFGFNKKDLEAIATNLSERQKIPPAVLFRPEDAVPANRPG
jgi:peroxiredoxin